MVERNAESAISERDFALWEWDWGYTRNGRLLHHAADLKLEREYGETQGEAVTSCGRRVFLMIPGIFSRMGMERCGRCCDALGYPRGIGSPKNDDECRPLVEDRLSAHLSRLVANG